MTVKTRRKRKKLPLAKRIPDPPKKPSNLTEEEKEARRQRLMLASAAQLKRQILAARESPEAFAEFVLRDPKGQRIVLEWFHREWIELLLNERRVQIEAPKAHGKTSTLLGLICWLIGVNPDIRIKLFAQSEEKARDRLSVTSDILTRSKLYKLVFPHIRPSPSGPWHRSAITVERSISDKEPTLEASGIMGSVEGGRADLIVLDDVSDFRTAIIYPQHREAIKKKVYAEVLPMLDEGGRAVSIATPHHQGDVVASLRKNREWLGKVYCVGSGKDVFAPLWPKKWPRKALIALRNEIGPTEYDRAYRCIPVSGESQIIRSELIRYYTAEMMRDPWALLCLQAYDLAGTVKRRSSYFACVTFLYDPIKNLVFVADAWHDKLAFVEQAQAIVREAAKWQPDRIVIEETGYQSALRSYLNEVVEEPLPIFPITPGSKSKELRLTETLPMFENEKIWFNPALDPVLDPNRSTRGDLIGQLLDFTQASDQDLGDAFAHGIAGLRSLRAAQDDGGGSWDTGEGMISRVSVL